jgi:serine/threonine-protein kinase
VDKLAKLHDEISNPSPQPDGTAASMPELTVTPSQFQPGQLVDGRYRVLSVIASGGFGCVYKVRDVLLKKTFALKTLHPIAASDKTMLRLQKEAQAAAMLNHPNLVGAVNFGFIDQRQPYLVMEFLEGPTLAQYLKQHTRIPWESALQIFIPVCYAMASAHDQGVIHRDIKPSNIILTGDVNSPEKNFIPKVVDFGIAKLQLGDESQALTKTGDVFGTPLYMSPEQCAGAGVDSRSDIYALGCVLFEALTGTPPFQGNTPLETMMRHATGEPPSLKEASLGLKFPEALEKLVSRMLAKDSRDRYQSFMEVGHDLLLLQTGDVDQMRVIAVPVRSLSIEHGKKPDWFLFSLGVIVGFMIAGSFAWAIFIDLQNTERATVQPQEAHVGHMSNIDKFAAEAQRDIFHEAIEPMEKIVETNIAANEIKRSQEQGEYAKAAELRQQQIAMDEKTLRSNDPQIAKDIFDLAYCYQLDKKYALAESRFKQAITIREKIEPDSALLANSFLALGDCYGNQGKYAQAEPQYRQALATFEKALGTDHPSTVTCIIRLAMCCAGASKYAEAESLFKRAITIRGKLLGPDHPQVADCLIALATCDQLQHKYAEAEELLKRAAAIRQHESGSGAGDFQSQFALARLYQAEGKYSEAEPLFKRVIAMAENAVKTKQPGANKTLTDCLDGYTKLLNQTHRYEEAKVTAARAEAIRTGH